MGGLVFDFGGVVDYGFGFGWVLMRVVLRLFGYCFGVGVDFGWWLFD